MKTFLERKTPLKKLKIPGQIHKVCPNKNLPQSKAVEVFVLMHLPCLFLQYATTIPRSTGLPT